MIGFPTTGRIDFVVDDDGREVILSAGRVRVFGPHGIAMPPKEMAAAFAPRVTTSAAGHAWIVSDGDRIAIHNPLQEVPPESGIRGQVQWTVTGAPLVTLRETSS